MKLMKHTRWMFYLFLIAKPILLHSRGEVDPIDRSSLTADLLAAVNESNRLLALIEINTAKTAANTTTASATFLDSTTIWPLLIDSTVSENTFKFTENVEVTATSGMTSAIIIDKDNVIIDLSGQTLSLATTALIINGIIIKQGVKGTKIISSNPDKPQGTIQNFTNSGIRVEGVSEVTVKNTSVDNVNCTYNLHGMYIEYAENTSITNSCCIANQNLTANCYGLYFKNINNTLVDNVLSSQNNSYQNAYGMYLENSTSATIQNCTTNLNYSTGNHTTRGSSYGVYITASGNETSSSNAILNCEANENYHTSNAIVVAIQESVGFMITTVLDGDAVTKSNTIENCRARRNISKPGTNIPTAGFGHGIKLYNTTENEVRSCTSSYNSTHGIVDSYPPTNTIPVSTSFFTSNICFFNTQNNYNVLFLEEPGTGDGTTSIKTVKIYIGNQIALETALQGYANVEIISE